MFRASQSRIPRTLLALLMPVALMLAPLGGTPLAAAVTRTALIDGSTVVGSPSQEEAIATAQGYAVTVVTDATWAAMTAAQFGAYDLLIAGDPACGVLPPGLISSASAYGQAVLGNVPGRTSAGNRVVVGTDPVFHDASPNEARGTIIRDGIAFAGAQPGTTGMYFDATCGTPFGQSAQTLSILDALSTGGGAWTIDAGPPCGGSVSLIASNSSFANLTTASLQGWNCSVHESFPTFRTDWSALAVATDTASHPTCGVDPGTALSACGEAYILIAGSNIVVNSQVLSLTPLDATNPVGTNHTVTANVLDVHLAPLAAQKIDFSVTGVNAGASGICVPVGCMSDASGQVSFTYLGGATAGDDTIKASFTDSLGSLQTATAQKHWVVPATHLTLAKLVNNTGGGTAAATDWTLSATGPTPISGHSGDAAITNATVGAGTYTLAESSTPTGYSAGSWSCTGGSLTSNSLTLTAGDTANCSITNTFIPITTCTSTSCTAQTTSPDGTVAAITSGPGSTITASFSTLAAAGFAGCTAFPLPPSLARSVLTLNVTGSNWPKLIKWVQPGAGPIRICWNAPSAFRQRGGGMAPKDAILGYSGVLPDCLSLRPTLPCVSPTVTKAGVSTIWILAPAGDPHGY